MAHFAKISNDNEVLTVLYVNDSDVQNSEGVEVESIGQAYLEKHNNWPANKWIQTSYNRKIRKNYAGIGFTWDAENQIFWPPQPYPSWTKDVATGSWVSPVGAAPELTEEQIAQNTQPDADTPSTNLWRYEWNESTTSWDLIDRLA